MKNLYIISLALLGFFAGHVLGSETPLPAPVSQPNSWLPVHSWRAGRHYWLILPSGEAKATIITSQPSNAGDRPGYWVSEKAVQMAVELGPDALRDFSISEVITVEGVRYFRVSRIRKPYMKLAYVIGSDGGFTHQR